MKFDWIDWERHADWLPLIGVAVAAVVAALLVHGLGRPVLLRVLRSTKLLQAVARRIDHPTLFLMPLMALQVVWQGAPNNLVSIGLVRHTNGILLIMAFTWAVIGAIQGVADGIIKLHPSDVADNLEARRVYTQTRVLSRIAIGGVLVAGAAFALMTFDGARQLGASLLASAGVVGLIAGIAAKPVFGNLIAGLQIALSQPIRIDDVLVLEGEWGRVEEITGTYVVLKIWDERRLIVPLQYFVEKPFQNWTRSSANIIGTVFLRVDYTMPLQPLREVAKRACEASPDWDRRLCLLQITDANSDRGMELRLLVSSASSSQNWDLRCAVREACVDFIQREYPHALPVLRAELGGEVRSRDEAPGPLPPRVASVPDRAGPEASPDVR
jgi:small-conductance mechanosensitive channel